MFIKLHRVNVDYHVENLDNYATFFELTSKYSSQEESLYFEVHSANLVLQT